MPSRNTYFKEDTVQDGVWSEYDMGSEMRAMHIVNRGANTIEFSFNGNNVDGKITATDFSESRDNMDEQYIYVRGVGGTADIQIEAWRGK